MSKDLDNTPKEPAHIKAQGRWRNHDIELRVKEDIKAKRLAPPPIKTEPDVGDVIKNDDPQRTAVIIAQTKFAKEIREMLKQHTLRNTLYYKLSLRHQKKRLLFEIYKRKVALQSQEKLTGTRGCQYQQSPILLNKRNEMSRKGRNRNKRRLNMKLT